MTLPALLQSYEGTPGIRVYAKVFKKITKELSRCHAEPTRVEILGARDARSALRRFFTLEKADQADHWLIVEARPGERPIKVVAPFRRSLTLPYTLEIGLASRLGFAGSLQRNVVLQARWEMRPETAESRNLATQLDAFGLPSINWRHDSGGLPIPVKEASRLTPTQDPAWPVTWTVVSGFQGFLFNVGPRVQKYVSFAPKLEGFLAAWKPLLAKPPPPKRTEAPAARVGAVPGPAPSPGQDALIAAAVQAVEKLEPGTGESAEAPLELPDQETIAAVMVKGGGGTG
ncbi:MAG TPA: hypothetical protein DFS52_29840 [Myxococcales bacterium]|nr:hypothetical protein [Myxococcales bacterium]